MRNYICFLAAALVCAIPIALSGQNWVYEQVEGPGSWEEVEIDAMPNGLVCVCYQDSVDRNVFLSWRDTVWRRDSLGPWPRYVGRRLVRGPSQRPAMLLGTDSAIVYAVDTDSGWQFTVEPWRTRTHDAMLAFDSAGNPAVVWSYQTGGGYHLLNTAYRRGGVWTEDCIYVDNPIMGEYFGGARDLALGPANRFVFMWGNSRFHTSWTGMSLQANVGWTDSWVVRGIAGGRLTRVYGVSLATAQGRDYSACYNFRDSLGAAGFYCDRETLETAYAESGVLRIDGLSRCQIVYRLGTLKHAYRTGTWHIDTLPPEINSATAFDFAIDTQDRPLIAFATESGIFLASRDAVGVEENGTQVTGTPSVVPSIVRGMLELPMASSLKLQAASLLDATGRRVLDLHPGPNDVSRLAPGVYFVAEQLKRKRQAQAVRKVVIRR